jgi:hypothetical protein
MKALSTSIGSLVAVSAMAYSNPSHAETAYRTAINHASAACMGSLPTDRDMTVAGSDGLANVESGVSDVKCGGAATSANNYNDVEYFETAIRNSTGATVEVDCMLIDGMGEDVTGVTTNYPQHASLSPGQVYWLSWSTADTGGSNFSFPSLSCQLPKDVSVVYTAVVYQEDIGL